MTHPLNRREFLKAAAAAAAVCSVDACGAGPSPRGLFFSAEELRTLAALCERIIPADDDPGAVEAGVVDFLDTQLAGPYADYQAIYRLGLQGLDQTASELYGLSFAELELQRQIEVLESLERSTAPATAWRRTDPGIFFRLAVAHTMYGYYGDPRHGGNRDATSWKMLGLPHPPVRGRDQYELDLAHESAPAQSMDGT